MNAILREQRETPVLTNEAIEVHLSYLRPAIEEVPAELPVLREKIDQVNKELTTGRFMKMQASLEGLKWFISSVALIVSGISVAHSLGWI